MYDFDIINNNTYIGRRYEKYMNERGEFPIIFSPYGAKKIDNISVTLCTDCGAPGHVSNTLILVRTKKG